MVAHNWVSPRAYGGGRGGVGPAKSQVYWALVEWPTGAHFPVADNDRENTSDPEETAPAAGINPTRK